MNTDNTFHMIDGQGQKHEIKGQHAEIEYDDGLTVSDVWLNCCQLCGEYAGDGKPCADCKQFMERC